MKYKRRLDSSENTEHVRESVSDSIKYICSGWGLPAESI